MRFDDNKTIGLWTGGLVAGWLVVCLTAGCDWAGGSPDAASEPPVRRQRIEPVVEPEGDPPQQALEKPTASSRRGDPDRGPLGSDGSPPGPPAPAATEHGAVSLKLAFPHQDPEPVDHVARARGHLEQRDWASAMLELEKALYDDPADFTAALLLGRAARAAGRRELALDAFVLASQIDAEAVEPWMQLARLALQRDQLNRAEQLCQRVLEIDDQCGGAHNLLGRIWLDRSHWERAIERFERALALQPDSLFYRNNLGLALIYRKDFQRAVEVLAPLAERSGVRAFMLNNLGLAYEGTGRLQDAIAQFENALERNEDYTNARINHERMVRVAQRDDAGSLEREEAAAGEADGASTSSPEDMPPESGSEDLILPAAVER